MTDRFRRIVSCLNHSIINPVYDEGVYAIPVLVDHSYDLLDRFEPAVRCHPAPLLETEFRILDIRVLPTFL